MTDQVKTKFSRWFDGFVVTEYLSIEEAMLAAFRAGWDAREWRQMESMESTLALPLRRNRAMQITAAIVNVIAPLIDKPPYRERDTLRDVSDAIFTLLYSSGAEIITDQDRHEAGLAPRGEFGLTKEELLLREARRLEVLYRPMQPLLIPAPPENEG